MAYEVKIPVFEGPLDLLLHLIDKNEVDIYNIPIAKITEQYLEYLTMAEEIDLELTSEFLVMACTLLSIKARMLLPKSVIRTEEEEFEEDPRQELVDKILEYKKFKEQTLYFRDKEMQTGRVYWRDVDEVQLLKAFPPSDPVGDVTVEDLIKTYRLILRRIERRNDFIPIVRDEITIQDKMVDIMKRLVDKKAGLLFTHLFEDALDKVEVIVTFMAILELARRGHVQLKQKGLFSDIMVFLKDTEGESHVAHPIS